MPCCIIQRMPRVPKQTLPQLSDSKETIGDRIARFRKSNGMTQQQLAEKIGIQRILISDYERGRIRLYDEMVGRFALALGITADELLGLTPSEAVEKPSLRISRRLMLIENLPPADQKALLKTIDNTLKGAGIQLNEPKTAE